MTQWEYKHLWIASNCLMSTLASMGLEGWELVGLNPEGGGHRAIFKRAISP